MMNLLLNTNYLWTAFSLFMIVILGTIVSTKSKFWDLFFTFILPIAVVTPTIIFLDRLAYFSDPIFMIFKIYTVLISAILVWFIRHKPTTVWGRKLRVLFFAINIIEAVIIEFTHGYWINPLAGLLLLVTLPGWRTLNIEKSGDGGKILTWDSSLLWVLAYTIWNNAFSINLFPEFWIFNTIQILVPLILIFRKPGWYAEVRAVSLNIAFTVMIIFLPSINAILNNGDKFGPFGNLENHQNFIFIYSLIALLTAIAATVQQVQKRYAPL